MVYLYGGQYPKRCFEKWSAKSLTGGLAYRLRNGVTGRGLVPEGRKIISLIRPCHASGV